MHQNKHLLRINIRKYMEIDKILNKHYVNQVENGPDFGLLEKSVLSSIHKKERQRLVLKLTVWGGVFVSAFVGLLFGSFAAYNQVVNSGILDLVYVAVSDVTVFATGGKEFVYSLAELMPILPISLVLAAFATLLSSARQLVKIENNFVSSKLYGIK